MTIRFQDIKVLKSERLTLGYDNVEKGYFLSIPVANRLVDYEEYYNISEQQFQEYSKNGESAKRFAEDCRQRLNDSLLLIAPGKDRGAAI